MSKAMLRDDRDAGGGRRRASRNVFGEPLEACSIKPMTGFYRDGCCNTGQEDIGSHTVCAVMTAQFLDCSSSRQMARDAQGYMQRHEFPKPVQFGGPTSARHWLRSEIEEWERERV